MKKSITAAITALAFSAALALPAMAGTCSHIDANGGSAYGGCELHEIDPQPVRGYLCKVIVVDPGHDTFTLMDCTGNTWIYEGIEDVQPGDFYTAAVDTRGTADVSDDVILSLTYERPDLFF